jgi:hypothetical protein
MSLATIKDAILAANVSEERIAATSEQYLAQDVQATRMLAGRDAE